MVVFKAMAISTAWVSFLILAILGKIYISSHLKTRRRKKILDILI